MWIKSYFKTYKVKYNITVNVRAENYSDVIRNIF